MGKTYHPLLQQNEHSKQILELFLLAVNSYFVFINSREAIAAIIEDIVVFYNSKNLNCIGALCFYDSKSIGEVLFLINFIGVIFEAGNETREKNWSDFGAEQK